MTKFLKATLLGSVLMASLASAAVRMPGIWSNWRGPLQSGVSEETGLPSSWSADGENLIWKAPVGGRSAPIAMGDRLYIVNALGEGETEQEQVLCLDANTGKTIWHYRFNVYGSDVPPHRVGWASPVGDLSTGRVYAMGVGGVFVCLDRNGKLIWEHSLGEEFGLITTHGGRTVTPVIYGDLIITSGLTSGWGSQAHGGHRYIACDKMTGEVVWVAQPGGAPYDTCYPTALLSEFGGKKLLVDGGADGAIYAMKALTGERVWIFPFSKRAINASVVTDGKWVYASHGQENYDTNVMGRVVALNPLGSGDISKTGEIWRADGLMVEFPSPVIHSGRLYMADNGANLMCLDSSSGKELWRKSLGTIQKASPVYADGKIYIGTENGKFYILKPSDTECKVLDVDELSKVAGEEEILASVAVAHGRVYLISIKNTYCIGFKKGSPLPKSDPTPPAALPSSSGAPVAFVQVLPSESIMTTGQEARFRARSYDATGNFIRQETATWSLAGLQGNITAEGKFSAAKGPQAGEVRATISGVTGAARARVIPPLPWSEDFESIPARAIPSHWVGAGGKFEVREVDGNKVLVKLSNEQSLLRRGRAYMGPWTLSNYTVEADILGIEKRRQMPDVGIIAQRYALVLAGNTQKLSIESWQPETKRSVSLPFVWRPNVWYRMKLRVDNQAGGKSLVRGKVWARSDPEPTEWSIVKEDPIPNLQGSPGLFCYAHNETYYDNIKVTENSK